MIELLLKPPCNNSMILQARCEKQQQLGKLLIAIAFIIVFSSKRNDNRMYYRDDILQWLRTTPCLSTIATNHYGSESDGIRPVLAALGRCRPYLARCGMFAQIWVASRKQNKNHCINWNCKKLALWYRCDHALQLLMWLTMYPCIDFN